MQFWCFLPSDLYAVRFCSNMTLLVTDVTGESDSLRCILVPAVCRKHFHSVKRFAHNQVAR